MSRAAVLMTRRAMSLALFMALSVLVFADGTHFRTGGIEGNNTIFVNQRFHPGDPSTAVSAPMFVSCNGLIITAASDLNFLLPPAAGIEFDPGPTPTFGGPNAANVLGFSFPDAGPVEKTFFLSTADFALGEDFTINNLTFRNFSTTQPFQLEMDHGAVSKLDSAFWMVANNPSASMPAQATVTPGVTNNPLGNITITESNVFTTPFNGAIWDTTDIRITIPAGFGVTWDQTATVTSDFPGKIQTITGVTQVNYSEDGGRTARFNVTGDFAQGEAVTFQGLRLNVQGSATDATFTLDIQAGGAANNTAHAQVLNAVQIQGLPRFTASTGPTLFTVGDPPSAAQSFTITESAGSPKITAGGDLRLNIPASFTMSWDTAGPAPTAIVTGIGLGAVAPNCIIEGVSNKTLRVDVTVPLDAGQAITISNARFAGFAGRETANGFIELEVGAIAGPEAVDTRGLRISQPTITSAGDHIFLVNQGATPTVNQITITEDPSNARIVNLTQLRLRMNGVNVVFAGTNPTLSAKLNGAVSFEDPSGGGFLTMVLTATGTFATSETATINSIPILANNPAAVGNFQLFMSGNAAATATSTDTALLVLGSLPGMSSPAQQFTVNDPLDGVLNLATPITITTDSGSSPLFQNGNSLEIVIPAGLNLNWRNTIQPTIGGTAAADVALTVTYPTVDTLRLAILNPWSGNETLTLTGLQFDTISAPSAPPGTSLQLRVRVGGPFAATDPNPKAIGVPSMASGVNQVFGINDPQTLMSPIVITEDGNTPRIRTGTNIRIRIPAGFNMTWANPLPTVQPGTGAGTVGTPSFPTPDVLLIPVTFNFDALQTLTISGANFAIGNTIEVLSNLELFVNGTTGPIPNAFDASTIRIGTRPTITSVFTRDANGGTPNGSIDRLVVTFSEAMNPASLSATTGLGFVVTGYNISQAGIVGTVLTLSIAETGQADTGATPALTYNVAAGDLVDANDGLELTAAPAATQDGAAPVIVSLGATDGNGNGFLNQVTFTFSEALSGTPDISRWILVDADGTTNLLQGLTSANFVINGSTLELNLLDNVGTSGTPRFQYLSTGPGFVLTDGTGNAVPTLTNNSLPVANAGADQSVIPQVVTLNGAASFDPDGAQTLSFSWTEVSRPPLAPAIVFTNPGSSIASFIPQTAGTYVVRLQVGDLIGSTTDTATITVLNVAPVSSPVFVRTSVNIPGNPFHTGQLSTDVNNDMSSGAPNTPLWMLVSRPATSTATLPTPTSIFSPGLVPDQPGIYELSFVVRDLAGNTSGPQSVFVTAGNPGTLPPVANAGPDLVVPVGTQATLHAGLSWSATAPTFTWTLPDSTTSALQQLPFTPPGLGLYTFKLTVTAGGIVSAPDTVTVMAYNPSNLPPVAFASKLSPPGTPFISETITLDSTGSLDPEGAPLTFAWTQVAGPTAALSNPAAARPSFAPVLPGLYEFSLVVFDGTQLSFATSVSVQVIATSTSVPATVTPSATGTPGVGPGHLAAGSVVTLNSTVSSSVTDRWFEQIGGPTVILGDNPFTTVPFTPTVAGTYSFRAVALIFGPNVMVSDIIHVVVDQVGVNNAPDASAGPAQTGVAAGATVTLNGTGSSADATTFFWSQIAGPPVSLSDPYAAQPTFVPTVGGGYSFQLIVSDGTAGSAPSFVTIVVDPAVVTPIGGGGGGGGGCGLTFEPLLLVGLLALMRRRFR